MCVLCALRDAYSQHPNPSGRFLIYTDNLNTVDMFSSLSALPSYNVLLRAAVDLLTDGPHDLCVLHVLGVNNSVADALSRADFNCALTLEPQLTIHRFEPYHRVKRGEVFSLQPPRDQMGAYQK